MIKTLPLGVADFLVAVLVRRQFFSAARQTLLDAPYSGAGSS